MIGLIAEIFREKVIAFLPNILHILNQKLKEATNELHDVTGETVEKLTRFCIRNLHTDAKGPNLTVMLSGFFELCNNENALTQTGACLCLSRIIQFSPPECLNMIMGDLISRIGALLRLITFKAHHQLFECLFSFLVVFKGDNEQLKANIQELIPNIIDNLRHKDSVVRKTALDLISMIHSLVPDIFIPFKDEVLEETQLLSIR